LRVPIAGQEPRNEPQATVPLFEALLSGDAADPAILSRIVAASASDDTLLAFISQLCQSPYDSVRAFVIKSDEEKAALLEALVASYSPFCVRYACVKALSAFADAVAHRVVSALQTDPAGRIRAAVPAVASGRSFWLGGLSGKFASDHDWSVRASVASSLVLCQNVAAAAAVAAALLADAVWQVKLCAMRSLTAMIPRIDGEVPDVRRSISDIRSRFHAPVLKKTVVDVFLAAYARAPRPEDGGFVIDTVTKEPIEVQLHFLGRAVAMRSAALVSVITGQLVVIVNRLAKSELWRERQGVTDLLSDLLELSGNEKLRGDFCELCFRMIKDEAWPVREAGVRQLANMADMTFVDGQLPPAVAKLAKSATFRDRQSALLLIELLVQRGVDDRQKTVLAAEVAKFAVESECPNIISLANSVLSRINGTE
jgi:hypothetical protein